MLPGADNLRDRTRVYRYFRRHSVTRANRGDGIFSREASAEQRVRSVDYWIRKSTGYPLTIRGIIKTSLERGVVCWRLPSVAKIKTNCVIGDMLGGWCKRSIDVHITRTAPQQYVAGKAHVCAQLPFLSLSSCFNEVGGIDRGLMHLAQLSREDPSRVNSGNSGQESKERGGTENRDRYIFAFAAIALLGLRAATMGIYCICYCGDALLGLGIVLEFVGGVAFIGGLASALGVYVTYNGGY